MGTATAGIAHAAIAGHILDMPMGYVRTESKSMAEQKELKVNLKKVIKLL